jgi:hypothetical protein
LHEPFAARWQVIDQLRLPHGKGVEVDDVDVSLVAWRQQSTIE